MVMMRSLCSVLLLLPLLLLLVVPASALLASTTPLQDGVLYVDEETRYFYIYLTNDREVQEHVRISMDPNSDYRFADSEFAFLYEQPLHPGQSVQIPIRINNHETEFSLSYTLESDTFQTYDSFLVMSGNEKARDTATLYTSILIMFACATMMVLYIWNRFVYHSYKIEYQKHKEKRKRKDHQEPSSAKL